MSDGKTEEPLWKQNEQVETVRLKDLVHQLSMSVKDEKDLSLLAMQALLAGLTAKAKVNAVIGLLRDGFPYHDFDERAISEANAVELNRIHKSIVEQLTTPRLELPGRAPR